MPIIKSAKKAARQAVKRTAKNQQIKKFIKNALKAFKANPTAENLSKAQSEYDKAAKKGLIKKNTASRRKASLVKIPKASMVPRQKPLSKKLPPRRLLLKRLPLRRVLKKLLSKKTSSEVFFDLDFLF